MKRAALALLVVGAVGAAEQTGKRTKREIEIKATEAKLTKVPVAGVGPAQPKGPVVTSEAFIQRVQGKVSKLRDKEIDLLKRLIQNATKKDPELPEYYFRLAEAYGEKSQYFNFQARELDQKIYEAKTQSEKNALTQRQRNYDAESKKWLTEGVKVLLFIAQSNQPNFLGYNKMDNVLFSLAFLLSQAKKTDEARVFFHRLIKDYPQSKYIPDAWLAFAEYYFNEGDMGEALKLYDKVAQYPDSSVYAYSIYKQGWCYLNLKEPQKALEKYVQVIKIAENKKDDANVRQLQKEARKDIVRAYASVGTPEKAWPFFQKTGGDYAPKMLEMLAELYFSMGKFVETIKSYRQIIGLNEGSERVCAWQNEVVKASLAAVPKGEQVKEVQRLANVYDNIKGKQGLKKGTVEECRAAASGILRELATIWHKEAQKTQNNDTYVLSGQLYREYLERFPEEKDACQLRFYYSELLFKLGEVFAKKEYWAQAAESYTRVVEGCPNDPNVKEAAYATVVAWKNALNVQDKDFDKSSKPDQGPMELSEDLRKMVAAFDTYLKAVPDAPERVQILYNKARIYYEHNRFDEAAPLFDEIATKYPGHELAVYAANLYLDTLNIGKKFDVLEKTVDRYLTIEELNQDPSMHEMLVKLKQESRWKYAEQLREQKKYKQAGELWESISQDYPTWNRYPQALFNSANMYEAAYLIGRAITVRTKLIKWDEENYGKTKKHDVQAQKAVFLIGANYHALAWYDKAAEYYEQFARGFPGEKEAVEALASATLFRMGLGEDDKALADASLFVKNYGRRPATAKDAAAVQFDMYKIYEKNKQWDKVVKHLSDYLKAWGAQGGVDRQIIANVKIAEILWRQSCPEPGVNGACIKQERTKARAVRVVKSKKKLSKAERLAQARLAQINMKQCGPDTKSKITVFARKSGPAKDAQNRMKTALSLYGGGKAVEKVPGRNDADKQQRTLEMLYAVAGARFMQAEMKYEEFLRITIPVGLTFDPGKKDEHKKKVEESKKKFEQWLDQKGKALDAASTMYQEVITYKVAHWAIAAAARIGQIYQNFSDQLYTAPIPTAPPLPKEVTEQFQWLDAQTKADIELEYLQTFRDSYCDTMTDKAEPIEGKAIEGLKTCLNKSTELSWFNEWSSLCESELNQIQPTEYPIASEIRARPGYVAKVYGTPAVIEEVK